MNPVKALQEHGQAVWLDFLTRGFVANGLKKLVEQDGVRGVTSNPSIFEKAIDGSMNTTRRSGIRSGKATRRVERLYEGLAVEDIQHAADVLRPVYEETGGATGMSAWRSRPDLATTPPAPSPRRSGCGSEVDRQNLMIKVPATPGGLPAIRQLIAKGINVNITLLFSTTVYERVVEAYTGGLEDAGRQRRRCRAGRHRRELLRQSHRFRGGEAIDDGSRGKRSRRGERLAALKGKVGIASAKLAYARYPGAVQRRALAGSCGSGGQTQRLLWASTSTKNPAIRTCSMSSP